MNKNRSNLDASVIIPTKNAGDVFEGLLEALQEQRGVNFEVIIVDSGSKDNTLQRSKRFAKTSGLPVKIFQIAPEDFGHGRTRNLAATKAQGLFLVYLTQDATPADNHWLEEMLLPFADPKVALVFGPHEPRADANPMIRAELNYFFAGFAEKGQLTTYATVSGAGVDRVGRANDDLFRFASNANAAYRKSAWEKNRFVDVPYAEDQLMARALLQLGWRKVYNPRAAVLHSHNFSVIEFFRRYVDEFAGLHRCFDHVEVKHFWHLPWRTIRASLAVRHAINADPRLSWWQKLAWYPRGVALTSVRQLGGYFGPRLDKMSPWLQDKISREAYLKKA